MAIVAPFSKYKKTNMKIGIAVCVLLAVIFAYDGYLSKYEWSRRQSFHEKHVKDGKADDTMIFNQKAPFVLLVIAVVFAGRLWAVKDKKLLADEEQLIISRNEKITYDSLQKIDKTNFDSKGFFIITYRNQTGRKINRKISDRNYDNLSAVLDQLIAKIS
jgi:predicted RND superfamily exporter protein